MVGAGAVVTRSVPPNAIVVGNPARMIGYTDVTEASSISRLAEARTVDQTLPSAVSLVQRVVMPLVEDLRGYLTAAELGAQLPFVPRRYFIVFNVPSSRIRGEHAHRRCEQLMSCVHGSVRIMVDDGRQREEYELNSPREALYVPPMVWAAQFAYSSDAVLLVLASHEYDAADYVRDYDEFLALTNGG